MPMHSFLHAKRIKFHSSLNDEKVFPLLKEYSESEGFLILRLKILSHFATAPFKGTLLCLPLPLIRKAFSP